MISLSLLIILLTLLFILSSKTTNLLFNLFITITKRKSVSISLLSLILYPGVVVHELSHFITAAILLTPVKSISLIPEATDTGIKSGSVTIGHIDIIRRTLIGIAPLFVGLFALWAVIVYVLPPIPYVCYSDPDRGSFALVSLPNESTYTLCSENKLTVYNLPLTTFLALYLLFSISTSMYSSKKDLEALKIMFPILIVLLGILYLVGFQIEQGVEILNKFKTVFQIGISLLIIPIVIQLFLYMLLKLVFLKRPTAS